MAEDEHTRRWERLAGERREADPLHALRGAINQVRNAPRDQEARRRLRALAAEQGLWEQLALLLADEARAATDRPDIAAACFEELADVYENLDQPLETITAMEAVVRLDPDEIEHLDRLAWLYRRAGAAVKAAETFERVADLALDDQARAAMRAAGKLYRDSGKHDQAIAAYRRVVAMKPSDVEAWRALDEILARLERWREVAEVRGALAARASGVDKAVLLRGQARALEQAGDPHGAAELVASAAGHAPEDVSGLVDYATVLAREGREKEAADVLATRIQQALDDGTPSGNISALRLRLVEVLDTCGDHEGAAHVLGQLLEATPEYMPGLELLVLQAAKDPDRRVHAEALLRYAAGIEGAEAKGVIAEAARRYRDAGDLRNAARTFERASEIAPDDEELLEELEDARTALVVEMATAQATAGEPDAAERRLRKILAARPLHLAANLALVDVMCSTDRASAAAEHLRATLANAPEDTERFRPLARPPGSMTRGASVLAQLVLRYARAMSQLGEADEAHQLLHEAHHLDRRDLQITLALGESCFGRKLWREAAIHLGSLAEHPDARRHKAAVAAGLAKAGQAEVRALRPQNANKHYSAAVQLDIDCAPAWHALAELATERGDMTNAAECLEHEASATKEPATRLRLYDALGDLALGVLQDEERAERCWSRVATAGSADVLTKLLALQRKSGVTIERGENCERLAALTGDDRITKQLTEEAAEAFFAGGDHARARAVAERLINRYPQDVDTVACASKMGLAVGDYEVTAGWLRRALGAWDKAGHRGDGNPRRAELWRRLGDAERGRRNERAALEAFQRAIVIAPDSEGALAARRGLIELAASTGRAAHTSRMVLVEAEQDPADIIASARELAAASFFDDARAMYELAGALGVELSADDETFLDAHPAKGMASDEAYAAPLDDHERRTLIDDPGPGGRSNIRPTGDLLRRRDGVLGEVLELVGEAASLVCPDPKTALDSAALSGARRIPTTSDAAYVAMYPQIVKALGGPPTLLFANPDRAGPALRLLVSFPAVVVIGDRLGESIGAELRFRLGRIVELSRPHRMFAAAGDLDDLGRLVAGLWHAFGKPDAAAPRDIVREAERLHHALPVTLRRRIAERLHGLAAGDLDPQAYLAACERAADRAGLLACGRVGVALHLAGGVDKARHLVQLAASQAYLVARRKLRRRA